VVGLLHVAELPVELDIHVEVQVPLEGNSLVELEIGDEPRLVGVEQ
jgi:hypothetical protein